MSLLPAIFLLFIPTISLIAIYERVARCNVPLYRAASISLFISLGALGIVAATLELTARPIAAALLVTLIQFELGAVTIFLLAAYTPTKVFPRHVVHPACAFFAALVLSATITGMTSPFVPALPTLVAPALALVSALAPLSLLARLLFVRATRARLWILLAVAQVTAVCAAVLGMLRTRAHLQLGRGALAIDAACSAIVVLWALEIICVFIFLPTAPATTTCDPEVPTDTETTPSPSPAPSSRFGAGHDTSDFLNLRDPFASPPPATGVRAPLQPLCPLEKPPARGYFGAAGVGMFCPRKAKNARATEDAGTGEEKPASAPARFPPPGDAQFAPYQISIDAEEALLSQLLLHNLSQSLLPPSPLSPTFSFSTPNASAAHFPAHDPLGLARGAVVVTCERRGSEVTLAPSTGRARYASEGSTLVDLDERRGAMEKELPPVPALHRDSVMKELRHAPSIGLTTEDEDEDAAEERRTTPTPPGLGGKFERDSPSLYSQYSQHSNHTHDADATPRAQSPS
ncbi:hypothetical protein HWV62_19123 [Athelia sp. TMB]|nr:hypothetical protein HWV62_19123 [Athelia sp. TMB]